jgi:hypothetical protein
MVGDGALAATIRVPEVLTWSRERISHNASAIAAASSGKHR